MTDQEKLTEEKIFDAAVDVFEEKGLSGARMQEIADKAGINKALLHYYYRTKEKLFDAVFAHMAGFLFEKLFVCLDKRLPWEQKIELFYQEHIAFLQSHPRLPSFILNEINQHPERIARFFISERITQMRRELFDQLEDEMKQGHIERMDKMQMLINILALSVFPFAARGLLEKLLEQENVPFNEFIEKRKKELPGLVINAVKIR
jgi:TetR/AcrR family transcriptional regulator